jgi:hypothetical protein
MKLNKQSKRYIFKLTTNQGYDIKTWFDTLYDCVEKVTLEIGYQGILTSSADKNSGIGTASSLSITEFNSYYINDKFFEDPLSVIRIPLATEDLYGALKSIKKGGTVSIYMLKDDDSQLYFSISLHGSKSIVSININNLDEDEWVAPQGYGDYSSFMISSSDFQKSFKQVDISSGVTLTGYENGMQLTTGVRGFINKSITLGKIYHRDRPISERSVSSKIMNRIIKCNGFKNNIKFYISRDSPLKISTAIGHLGHINIYLWNPEKEEF